MTSWITICDTCKREDWPARGLDQTDGERFAERIERAASGVEGVATRRHPCLMGCSHGCNIAIQGADKLAYTLGDFEGTDEDAAAVVEYARLHAQSSSGQVAYRSWPTPVKGHFVTRHPPLPDAE